MPHGKIRPMELSPAKTRPAKIPREDVLALAEHIQQADNFVQANACNKLSTIAEQMKFLHRQALQVLKDAKRDNELHHVACSFKKVPGKLYHLYKKEESESYFSMLSPEDWGISGAPHRYLESYRLEYDQSWTPEEEIAHKDSQMFALKGIVSQQAKGPGFLQHFQSLAYDVKNI